MKKIVFTPFILLLFTFFTINAQAGKNVYPVDAFGLASGTIYDILRLIPLVQVADDGTVSIRGSSSTQVMIDGRPASPGGDYQAVVQQLTIEMVKQVEVITTPSARYDSEADGGIVNLVLAGAPIEGTSGAVSAMGATGDKYSLNGSFGVRKGKWSGRLNLVGQQYKAKAETNTYTETYYPDETVYTRQNIVNRPEIRRLNANGSVDYHIDAASTIQLLAALGDRKIKVDTEIESISTDEDSNYSYINRRKDEGGSNRIELNYDRRLSAQEDRAGNLGVNASWYLRKTTDFRQQRLIYDDVKYSDLLRTNLQMDYEKKLGQAGKIETGVRSYLRSTSMDYNRDRVEDDGSVTPIQADNFEFNEQVHAAYAQWQGSIKHNRVSLGLRSELSYTEGVRKLVYETFDNDYLHLFPSAHVSHEIDTDHKLSFSYNRTIRRPAIFQINPFVNDMNPNNIQYGNPELKPALTDHFELKYEGQYQSKPGAEPRVETGAEAGADSRTHKWYAALLYKHRQDQIYRAALPSSETEGVIENSYHNMKSGYDVGVEMLYSVDALNWCRLDITPRYSYIYRDGTNIDPDIESSTDRWQVRANLNIDLWQNARLMINTLYISGYDSPQGSREAVGLTNFRFQQLFPGNKLTLTAALKDPFNQSKTRSYIRQPDFISDSEVDPETAIFELTVRYDFGQFKTAPADRPDDTSIFEEL